MKFEKRRLYQENRRLFPLIYIVVPDLALSPQKKETLFHNPVFWGLNEESHKWHFAEQNAGWKGSWLAHCVLLNLSLIVWTPIHVMGLYWRLAAIANSGNELRCLVRSRLQGTDHASCPQPWANLHGTRTSSGRVESLGQLDLVSTPGHTCWPRTSSIIRFIWRERSLWTTS